MKEQSKKAVKFTRRGILPILGSTFLLPFVGNAMPETEPEEAYQTLLKPDGTVVKIKASAVKNAKVIDKKVSNKNLLSWLGKKL